MLGTKLAIDEFNRNGKGGAIVNTASLAGLLEVYRLAAYATAKAGVVHLARCLRPLAASRGIRVNAICPGTFGADSTSDTKFDDFIHFVPASSTHHPRHSISFARNRCCDDALGLARVERPGDEKVLVSRRIGEGCQRTFGTA